VALSEVYLVDKSALARYREPAVRAVIAPLLAENRVATCGIIDLEILYSGRSHSDLIGLRADRQALIQVAIMPIDFERALEVITMLASVGQHRLARIPDLLLAATAERVGLCVMHYDQDFDRIAQMMGQRAEWVVPRASV
jgi:predicted nucleic acid-binding protein